jgi:hypothetical protein
MSPRPPARRCRAVAGVLPEQVHRCPVAGEALDGHRVVGPQDGWRWTRTSRRSGLALLHWPVPPACVAAIPLRQSSEVHGPRSVSRRRPRLGPGPIRTAAAGVQPFGHRGLSEWACETRHARGRLDPQARGSVSGALQRHRLKLGQGRRGATRPGSP